MSSGQSDLALLDIAAGHFGHVKLLTASEIEFTFPKEIAILADKFLRRHMSAAAISSMSSETGDSTSGVHGESDIQRNFDDLSTFMIGLEDTTNEDFETWNAMSTEALDGFLGSYPI
ncbi:hypothetical protein Plec18167_004351 [Paecilomyces lecythidis]|uniref:Uncharacterized protein n=1 Tax=Paecilomyces lecythidis TaxID=3004212 RepID=A0ABR3XSS7_9EURO